ncbi:MAG: superoxide dismutase [Clostridia bacterium]|nr:superoxide dismutase [Clostridia bacterium]
MEITENINNSYPFTLEPLPYGYDALEPYIDKETMHFHHDKHHQTYVDNLNRLLKPYPVYHEKSLEDLIKYYYVLPPNIREGVKNNAGGVYNHNLFWKVMSPAISTQASQQPSGNLNNAVIKQFLTFGNFKSDFTNAALLRFGSGYAWLVTDKKGHLGIVSTANQDTFLHMDVCSLLLLDVWEHAYYLKYQNRRSDYISNWWNIVNWNYISDLYDKFIQ